VLAAALAAASRDTAVLIVGEPGTGKRALAQLMHDASPRWNTRFLAFGAEDAEDALTAEGTVFINPVMALSDGIAARLLGVLAGVDTLAVDTHREAPTRHARGTPGKSRVRLICGTTPLDLRAPTPTGARLLAVLGETRVLLPPLRRRREDIPALAGAYARWASGGAKIRIEPDALAALQEYDWPGNIPELRDVIARALAPGRPVLRLVDVRLPDQPRVPGAMVQ
jgi:DNA-binding NtrC family response regulator